MKDKIKLWAEAMDQQFKSSDTCNDCKHGVLSTQGVIVYNDETHVSEVYCNHCAYKLGYTRPLDEFRIQIARALRE